MRNKAKSDLLLVAMGLATLLAVAALDAGGGDRPVRAKDRPDITEPEIVAKVAPVYPEDARKEKVEGVVVLDAVVEKDGSVTEIEVVESADERLNEAARQAVSQWRYKPARLDSGEPVAVIVTLTVKFRLQ